MNNFSPNMLKTFYDCQKKFFFRYVKKLSIPQRSSYFEKGKKIHALANYYLSGFDISKMEAVLNPDEKNVWENLKVSEFFKLQKVATEYNLSCKVGEYWVGGRLDALMCDMSNEKSVPDFIILDYKTGSIPKNPEYDFQTMVYLLAADKFLFKKGGYNSLKFVYIDLKNSLTHEIVFSAEKKSEFAKRIIETCEKINSAIETNTYEKGKFCDKCEFKNLCEKELA